MKKRKRRVITEDDEEEAIIIDDSSDKTKASADDITEEELAYCKLAKEAQDNLWWLPVEHNLVLEHKKYIVKLMLLVMYPLQIKTKQKSKKIENIPPLR